MLVVPNLGSLYEDDDVPEYEREDLFESALTMLRELADVHDLPVLVTNEAGGTKTTVPIAKAAAHRVDAERTAMSLHYSGNASETTVYVRDGFWQTTIPYWVDLLGAVDALDRPALDTPTDLGPATISAFG